MFFRAAVHASPGGGRPGHGDGDGEEAITGSFV
jgi:hypothetical protein